MATRWARSSMRHALCSLKIWTSFVARKYVSRWKLNFVQNGISTTTGNGLHFVFHDNMADHRVQTAYKTHLTWQRNSESIQHWTFFIFTPVVHEAEWNYCLTIEEHASFGCLSKTSRRGPLQSVNIAVYTHAEISLLGRDAGTGDSLKWMPGAEHVVPLARRGGEFLEQLLIHLRIRCHHREPAKPSRKKRHFHRTEIVSRGKRPGGQGTITAKHWQ